MSARRPTIVDVASRAGVSKSTVSLVIRRPQSVKLETRTQVQAAMSELGYVYNRAAASMRSGEGGLIGVLINDLRNPFFSEFAASFQSALAGSGYLPVLANSDEDPIKQAELIKAMIQHGVSALVISPAYGDLEGAFDDLITAGIPLIQVMRQVDERFHYFPFIAPDYFEGGKQATEHLVALGAKRIAFVGGLEDQPVAMERRSGYLAVMEQYGLEPLLFHGKGDRAFGKQMAHCLMATPPRPEAVVCFNDFVALGFSSGLNECRDQGVSPSILVVGFDDIDEAKYNVPPVSSVHCDIPGLAALTADALKTKLATGNMPWTLKRTPVRFYPRF